MYTEQTSRDLHLRKLTLFLFILQTLYVLVYAIFITSALSYLLITWANMHISSIIVTAFWPVQVCTCTLSSVDNVKWREEVGQKAA